MPSRSKSLGRWMYVPVGLFMVATVVTCLGIAHQDLVLTTYHSAMFHYRGDVEGPSAVWLVEHPAISLRPLVSQLQSDDAAECEQTGKLLTRILADHQDPTDPEHAQLSLNLASMIQKRYNRFSVPGKQVAVILAYDILEQHLAKWSPNVATALATAGEAILLSLRDLNRDVVIRSHEQLPRIWAWEGLDSVVENLIRRWKRDCNRIAVEHLSSPIAELRVAAARSLAGSSDHEGDSKLLELMNDENVDVCRAALETILTTAADSVGVDHRARLVQLLEHSSPDIASLARTILLKSGLDEAHLKLAVLMKNDSADERAKVAEVVFDVPGVDRVGVLQQLAKDSSPLVRRAAIRATTKVTHPSLKELVKQLSADDPDPEVRQACQQILTSASAEKPASNETR